MLVRTMLEGRAPLLRIPRPHCVFPRMTSVIATSRPHGSLALTPYAPVRGRRSDVTPVAPAALRGLLGSDVAPPTEVTPLFLMTGGPLPNVTSPPTEVTPLPLLSRGFLGALPYPVSGIVLWFLGLWNVSILFFEILVHFSIG